MKIVDKIKQNSWNYFILEAVLWIAFLLLWKRKNENITSVMLAEEKKILDSDFGYQWLPAGYNFTIIKESKNKEEIRQEG